MSQIKETERERKRRVNRAHEKGLERALRKDEPYPGAKFFMRDGTLYFGWVDRDDDKGCRGMWVEVFQSPDWGDETPGQKAAARRVCRMLNQANRDHVAAYDPKFGDQRVCRCGHPYARHFDSYEDNAPVGCKYCDCSKFVEKAGKRKAV